jgi:lysozyme
MWLDIGVIAMGIKAKLATGACTLTVVIASYFGYSDSNSRLSVEGVTNIINCEGCNRIAYKDVAGIPTIGVGSTQGVVMGTVITDDEVGRRLAKDLRTAESCFRRYVKVDVTQGEYDGWVSFIFNKGCGAFKESTALKLLNSGQHKAACKDMLKWNKITVNGKKVFSQGVYNRSLKDSQICVKQL